MRYLRCKCGQSEMWSSMGSPSCEGCDECHTTFAEGMAMHQPIAPHDWRERWKEGPATDAPQKERVCIRCMKSEDVPDEQHVVDVGADNSTEAA